MPSNDCGSKPSTGVVGGNTTFQLAGSSTGSTVIVNGTPVWSVTVRSPAASSVVHDSKIGKSANVPSGDSRGDTTTETWNGDDGVDAVGQRGEHVPRVRHGATSSAKAWQ